MVVVAGKMQDAVHHQMRQVMRGPATGQCGLAPDHAERQHDFGRRFEVGQHVAVGVVRPGLLADEIVVRNG